MKWWLNLATNRVLTLADERRECNSDGIRDASLFITVTSKRSAAFCRFTLMLFGDCLTQTALALSLTVFKRADWGKSSTPT